MIILLPNREWNQKQKHEKRLYQSPKTIFDGRDAIIRPHQMTDIQYGITIMGGREVSRPYWVGFSPKASGFCFWSRPWIIKGWCTKKVWRFTLYEPPHPQSHVIL